MGGMDVLLEKLSRILDEELPDSLVYKLWTNDINVLGIQIESLVDGSDVLRFEFEYPSSESSVDYIAKIVLEAAVKLQKSAGNSTHKTRVAEKADTDVQALRTELETLKSTLAQQPTSTSNNEQLVQVQASLTAMEARVFSLTEALPELTVPIYIPPREEMAPRLICSQAFTRLEESRSDEQWAIAVLFLTLGSIVGMLINYATAESASGFEITRAGQVALGLFVFAFVVSIVWLVRIHRRVNEAKGKVLASSTEVLKRRAGPIGGGKG